MQPRHRTLRSLILGLATVSVLAGSVSVPPSPEPPTLQELKGQIRADNPTNPVASVRWAEQALQRLAAQPDPATEIWFLTSLVGDLNVLGEYPRAEAYLARARDLVARAGDLRSHLRLEIAAASLLDATEKHVEARRLLEEILPQLERLRHRRPQDDELGHALEGGYRLHGSVLQTLGRYPEAIAAYQKAQATSEAMGDRKAQAIVLNQMATLYSLIDRVPDALAAHHQAIQIAQSLSDLGLEASVRLDQANSYAMANEPDAQLAALQRALDLAAEAGDPGTEVVGMCNLADAYLRKRDYRAALKHAEAALRLPAIQDDPGSVALCQVNRGIALNRLGRTREGLKAIENALVHIQGTQAKGRIAEVTGNLAEEYAFAGDFRKAYELALRFKRLSDDLKRAEDQRHIAEASAAFESDRQQFQIEALRRDQRNQARLLLLWTALGILGFSLAGFLVFNRRSLTRLNRALESANRALAEASMVDPLTGLRNRRYLSLVMPQDAARVLRPLRSRPWQAGPHPADREVLIFFMLDIDHFKAINDGHGHAAGDSMLVQVAQVLTATCRETDTLVRWGGEEFLVMTKGSSIAHAPVIARNLLDAFRAHPFQLPSGEVLYLTCSIGYAPFPLLVQYPEHLSWEAAADLADHCLYTAKRSGRNGWVGISAAATALRPEGADALPRDLVSLVGGGYVQVESSFPDRDALVWMAPPPAG